MLQRQVLATKGSGSSGEATSSVSGQGETIRRPGLTVQKLELDRNGKSPSILGLMWKNGLEEKAVGRFPRHKVDRRVW
ncbi:hypothetical protein CGRA01v4_08671 [Colletotrichum graminicola]|nr:hypothetical protein CGRA01v4_08671 [Colletotrichum graminicola]